MDNGENTLSARHSANNIQFFEIKRTANRCAVCFVLHLHESVLGKNTVMKILKTHFILFSKSGRSIQVKALLKKRPCSGKVVNGSIIRGLLERQADDGLSPRILNARMPINR